MARKTASGKRRAPRLIAIDVGNTRMAVGFFVGERLAHSWGIRTDRRSTADDYRATLEPLFRAEGIKPGAVEGLAMCSVVPALTEELLGLARSFGVEALNLEPASQTVMPVAYEPPGDVGADRIANAIAAKVAHGVPAIVVDLGTATTVDAVSRDGVYLGGAIAPGLWTSLEALLAAAAKLTGVRLRAPGNVIGRTTEEALASGVIYGHAAQVEGVVRRMQRELGGKATVVGTGGAVELVAPHVHVLDEVRPHLTLEGLYHFWALSR